MTSEKLYTQSGDPFLLLSEDFQGRILQPLIDRFKKLLPPHFAYTRFVLSQLQGMDHVLRADCQRCRTRAVLHFKRDGNQCWNFIEEEIQFDRLDHNCCVECEKLKKL